MLTPLQEGTKVYLVMQGEIINKSDWLLPPIVLILLYFYVRAAAIAFNGYLQYFKQM